MMNQIKTYIFARELEWIPFESILKAEYSKSNILLLEDNIIKTNMLLKKKLGLSQEPIILKKINQKTFLKFNGISGVLQISKFHFEIAPKFIRQNENNWQKSLINFINIANRKWFHFKKISHAKFESFNFYDHIALVLLDEINEALRYDSIKAYNSKYEESFFLKGTLLLQEQVNKFFTQPGKIIQEVDSYDTENEYNYLINWTLKELINKVNNNSIRSKIDCTINLLPRTSKTFKIPVYRKISPQYAYFEEVIRICNMIAEGYSITQNYGNDKGYGLVINMSDMYEGFIENLLHNIAKNQKNWNIKPQASNIFAKSLSTNESDYYTIPDNKLIIQEKSALLIDAKYKSTITSNNKRPVNSDIYQIYASMKAHDCTKGLLLHPKDKFLTNDQPLSIWKIEDDNKDYYISSFSIDISDISNIQAIEKIKDILCEKIYTLINL